MEKRGLFDVIFGRKAENEKTPNVARLEMMTGYNAIFTPVSSNTFESKVARECIDRIATHSAKLVPKHIKGKISQEIHGDINYLLQTQPNPLMTKYEFIYKVVSMLLTDSNAFIYINKDKTGAITGFYPVLALSYELYQDKNDVLYLQFRFVNGKDYYLPYLDLIHLRKFYNRNDLFGSGNDILKTDLETVHTASEGIKNAIKTSNNLRGILKFSNAMLKPKDIKESKDAFVEDFLNMNNKSGIAGLDAKADFTEVNLKPITLDKDQLSQVNKNIFDYYGISEAIINNDYSESQWNAFYEGVIEPLSIQLSDAFTTKIFSDKALKQGHRIIFSTNRLQYASLQNKVNLIKEAGALGLLRVNDAREILDLAPIIGEEGERILQSLNYVDTKIANEYQGGGE